MVPFYPPGNVQDLHISHSQTFKLIKTYTEADFLLVIVVHSQLIGRMFVKCQIIYYRRIIVIEMMSNMVLTWAMFVQWQMPDCLLD